MIRRAKGAFSESKIESDISPSLQCLEEANESLFPLLNVMTFKLVIIFNRENLPLSVEMSVSSTETSCCTLEVMRRTWKISNETVKSVKD